MSINLADLVNASNGIVVGKIRLQKIVYLLEQLGLESGLEFSYHHYGPYSSELSDQTFTSTMSDDLIEETRKRKADGVPYSVFLVPENYKDISADVGSLTFESIKKLLNIMNEYSSTELELAATAHWLYKYEEFEDWNTELKRRKGVKTEGGRTDKALKLLSDLDLDLK